MVLEDDDIFMELNQRILQKSGLAAEMICFDYAEKGLDELRRRAAENLPLPDFILLDLRMPLLNGFEFLERIKAMKDERVGKIKIHLLTSSLDENDIARAFTYSNVFGFHSKPLSVAKLDQIVKSEKPIRPLGL